MFSKVIFIALYLFSVSLCSFCQNGQSELTLNEKVNKAIDSTIKSLPPKVEYSFFINGREVKKTKKFSICFSNKTISNKKENYLNIPQVDSYTTDSLHFSLEFKDKSLTTSNFPVKMFEHGGKIIFTVITDYKTELKKYNEDSTKYFQSTERSYIWRFIRRTKDKYESMPNNSFYYIIIKPNSSYWTTYLDGIL
jgi:hypothetical protein